MSSYCTRLNRTKDPQKQTTAPVDLYDWRTGARLGRLTVPSPSDMSLSSDGANLACLSGAGTEVYSVATFKPVARLKEYCFGAPAVFWGTTVALPRPQQYRIHLWNFAASTDVALLDEPEETSPVAFTGKGDGLLTFGSRHACLYRLDTPEKLDLPPHSAAVPGIAFSPDGTRLASAGKDRVVRVCDALSGRILWSTNDLPGEGQCLGFSPDGKLLAVGLWDRNLLWIREAQSGERILEVQTNRPGSTLSAQFSPDGRFLAMAGRGATNEVAAGTRLWKLEAPRLGDTDPPLRATLVKSWRNSCALLFAPDSRSVVLSEIGLGTLGQQLLLWDFERSPEPRPVGMRGPGTVECISYTPDGGRLLALSDDGSVVTLEVATRKRICSFPAWNPQAGQQSSRSTQFLSLSPDGSRLALSSASRLGVDIRNPGTGELLYSLCEEAGTVYWLAWSPDSRRIAVSRDNGNIAIWNLEVIGQILAQLGLRP